MKRGKMDIVGMLTKAEALLRWVLTPQLRARAVAANEWLSADDIDYAVDAICKHYLDPTLVAEWLDNYTQLPTTEPKIIGVVAAGNIPLAPIFDILCVVAAGHRCKIKFSSKDMVLTPAVCQVWAEKLEWSIEPMQMGDRVDAIIASGSDTAIESIATLYDSVPTLLRGHRSSVALLDGHENKQQLALLTNDAFRYNSLGCRNVTLILAPHSITTECIVEALESGRQIVAQGYLNNCRQAVATAMLTGREIVSGGHFVVENRWEFPARLAQINIAHYDTLAEAEEWIAQNDLHIQCVVTEAIEHSRKAPLGQAQQPRLTDWPDGVDVMSFLERI